MSSPAPTDIEIKIAGEWRSASVAEAHAQHRDALKRCPDCHGQVHTAGTYGPTERLKVAHYRLHTGCPRHAKFTGTPSPHPRALS